MSLSDKFYVTSAGALTATGADIGGKITASSGKIGGWNIGATSGTGQLNGSLYSGTFGSSGSIYLIPGGVTTSLTIASRAGTDWIITAASNFGVTSSGFLYANSATIKGTINADYGYIGPWQISENAIYNGRTGTGNGYGSGIYIGKTGISAGYDDVSEIFIGANGNVTISSISSGTGILTIEKAPNGVANGTKVSIAPTQIACSYNRKSLLNLDWTFGVPYIRFYYNGNSTSTTQIYESAAGKLNIEGRLYNQRTPTSWVEAIKATAITIDAASTTSTSAAISGIAIKTKNGYISLDTLPTTDDNLYIHYISQINYNAGTNTVTAAKISCNITGHADGDLSTSGGTVSGQLATGGKENGSDKKPGTILSSGGNLYLQATNGSHIYFYYGTSTSPTS